MTKTNVYTRAEDRFIEAFEDYLDTSGDALTLLEDAELPPYWEDKISEIADNMIPDNRTEVLEAWADLNFPDVEDLGGVEGVTDVRRIVEWTLYEQYSGMLWGFANDAGFYN